jgi:hypothetical protein
LIDRERKLLTLIPSRSGDRAPVATPQVKASWPGF